MAQPRHTRFFRMERFVRVHPGDNWAPNYRGDRVRVVLLVDGETLAAHVRVSGADDTAVEAGPLGFGEGAELYARVARNTCPPWRSLLSRWGFRTA